MPARVTSYRPRPWADTIPPSTSSRMYSETAWGVTPSFPAISCCRMAGWFSAISTRIWKRVASLLDLRIVVRGSSFPMVGEHHALALHVQPGDPLREALDHDLGDVVLPGDIVYRGVPLPDLLLDLVHEVPDLLVVREGHVDEVG